jgi:hypothetical protein
LFNTQEHSIRRSSGTVGVSLSGYSHSAALVVGCWIGVGFPKERIIGSSGSGTSSGGIGVSSGSGSISTFGVSQLHHQLLLTDEADHVLRTSSD